MIKNKELKRRLIEISYKLKLGHIGSCLTAIDIIAEIYANKKPNEKFILSAGHAHVAHLVVMDKYGVFSPTCGDKHTEFIEEIVKANGIHCDRRADCDVSTGSLGHGIGIALGMALADRTKNVYCVISDGECAEGSVWEALRIQKEQYVDNLFIQCNINGWGAYDAINGMELANRLTYSTWAKPVFTNLTDYPTWLQGQGAHYKVLNEGEYNELMELLK